MILIAFPKMGAQFGGLDIRGKPMMIHLSLSLCVTSWTSM